MQWLHEITSVSTRPNFIDNWHSNILAAQSEIVFEHGEISKIIAITIINDLEAEKDESFAVELYEPTGGAQLGKHVRTVVTIINDDGMCQLTDERRERICSLFKII